METTIDNNFLSLMKIRLKANVEINKKILGYTMNSTIYSGHHSFVDQFGHHNGYIIWANITRESVDKLLRTGAIPKFSYEWGEGRIKLLLDVVFVGGLTRHNHMQFRQFIKAQRAIVFIKKGCCKLFIRKNYKFKKTAELKFNKDNYELSSLANQETTNQCLD
jgi:hemolysin-activating ACP:hemolysin acyltransferase